ncbi:MAG: amino acid racemase [Gammaproteobacteria bacterium]
MSEWRIAGVLGGMGPMATVDFLAKVVTLTPAARDQDHVPMAIIHMPQIPDRSTAILESSDAPFSGLLHGLNRLAAAGAQFAVIPCNSAHHWYQRLADAQPLKILHIADAVSIELRRRKKTSEAVSVLATRGTLRSGFYAARLRGNDQAILPVDTRTQQLIDQAIGSIKAGRPDDAARFAEEGARRALAAGARTLVLACTELPLALKDSPLLEACVDSTMELARCSVAESMSTCRTSGSQPPGS